MTVLPTGHGVSMLSGAEMFAQAKTMWSLAEWEPNERKRNILAREVIAKLDSALRTELDPQLQAACYNIRGQCQAKVGEDEEARISFRSALKLNKNMRQAQINLDQVNSRLHIKSQRESTKKTKRNKQKYCCYFIPRQRCCKPDVVRYTRNLFRTQAPQSAHPPPHCMGWPCARRRISAGQPSPSCK